MALAPANNSSGNFYSYSSFIRKQIFDLISYLFNKWAKKKKEETTTTTTTPPNTGHWERAQRQWVLSMWGRRFVEMIRYIVRWDFVYKIVLFMNKIVIVSIAYAKNITICLLLLPFNRTWFDMIQFNAIYNRILPFRMNDTQWRQKKITQINRTCDAWSLKREYLSWCSTCVSLSVSLSLPLSLCACEFEFLRQIVWKLFNLWLK